jgi:hypothetical protein
MGREKRKVGHPSKEKRMNPEAFSEWLSSLSVSERIRGLTLIYSGLTVGTRQLFLPDLPKGRDQAVLNMLHGVNELHHTLANWLVDYATDESGAFPVGDPCQELLDIASQYHIEGLLTSAVEFARTRNSMAKK